MDIEPLLKKFEELQGNERIKAQRQASGKALKVIKTAVLNQMQLAGIPMDRPNKKYPDQIPRDGVRMSVYKDGEGGSVYIHPNVNYALIFVNQGTKKRGYTPQKGKRYGVKSISSETFHETGGIESRNFIGKGLQSAESTAINILNTELEKAINDLWKKR